MHDDAAVDPTRPEASVSLSLPDVAQIAGALCVLAGFAATQFGVLRTQSRAYLLLNLAGSAVLAVLAAVDREPGFLLLEGVWALVSGWGLLRAATAA
jgi:hypothetical protein